MDSVDQLGCGMFLLGALLFLLAGAMGGQGGWACVGLVGILLLAPIALSKR